MDLVFDLILVAMYGMYTLFMIRCCSSEDYLPSEIKSCFCVKGFSSQKITSVILFLSSVGVCVWVGGSVCV